MFGQGKRKMSLEEFCKNITSVLIQDKPVEWVSEEHQRMFSSEEQSKIKEELLIFKTVVLNLLLVDKAMQGRVKKKPYNIGLIVSGNTKEALKKIGFDKKMIEEFGIRVLKEIEFQVKDLAERDLSNLNELLLQELVCANFVKWLASQGDLSVDPARETAVLAAAHKVYQFTAEVFENAFNQAKVLK